MGATLTSGWTSPSPTTAKFTVNLVGASCTPATPVDPTVVQAECVGGVTTPASVTLPPNGGGMHVLDEPGVAGGWEPGDGDGDVVALVTPGSVRCRRRGCRGIPAATKATYSVRLEYAPCTPVVPLDPTVTQATCANGVVTVPTVTPATGPTGVSYALAPAGPYTPGTASHHTVTVTATLSAGQKWGGVDVGVDVPVADDSAVHRLTRRRRARWRRRCRRRWCRPSVWVVW